MSRKNTIDDILKRVNRTESCWLWAGPLEKSGHAKVRYQGQMRYVHVLMYLHFVGENPRGLFVLHTCNVAACCNPKHLKLGTHADNRLDYSIATLGLTLERRQEIRDLYATGKFTQGELCRQFKIDQTTVSTIVKRTDLSR